MNFPNDSVTQFAKDRLAGGCDTMRQRLHGLLDAKGRVAEEVHAIRKLGKSLRGGFSLFRLEKSAALEIQAIGRLLAGPRDAVSRLKTWNKLGWVGDPQGFRRHPWPARSANPFGRPPPATGDHRLVRRARGRRAKRIAGFAGRGTRGKNRQRPGKARTASLQTLRQSSITGRNRISTKPARRSKPGWERWDSCRRG